MTEKKPGVFDKLKESVAKLHEDKPEKVSAEQMAGHVQAAKPAKDEKDEDSPRQGAGSNGGGGAF
jgi:hypothetical protein